MIGKILCWFGLHDMWWDYNEEESKYHEVLDGNCQREGCTFKRKDSHGRRSAYDLDGYDG